MKLFRILLLVAPLVCGLRADSRFFVEAGASEAFVSRADEGVSPGYVVIERHDDRSQAAPFVGVGAALSNRFQLRAAYHHIADLESRVETIWDGPSIGPYHFSTRTKDDVHLLSVAPEWVIALRPRLSLSLAPTINWVASRGVVHNSTNAPHISIIPTRDRNEDDVTFGASVGLAWAVGNSGDVVFSYRYADLEPSFGRAAQLVSAGWRWRF